MKISSEYKFFLNVGNIVIHINNIGPPFLLKLWKFCYVITDNIRFKLKLPVEEIREFSTSIGYQSYKVKA